MLSVDTSGVVPVGVSPLRPFGARPLARRDSLAIRMENKRVVTTLRMENQTAIMAAAWQTKRLSFRMGLQIPRDKRRSVSQYSCRAYYNPGRRQKDISCERPDRQIH